MTELVDADPVEVGIRKIELKTALESANSLL